MTMSIDVQPKPIRLLNLIRKQKLIGRTVATASDCKTPSTPRTTKYVKLASTNKTVTAVTLMTIDNGRFLYQKHTQQTVLVDDDKVFVLLIIHSFIHSFILNQAARPINNRQKQ